MTCLVMVLDYSLIVYLLIDYCYLGIDQIHSLVLCFGTDLHNVLLLGLLEDDGVVESVFLKHL